MTKELAYSIVSRTAEPIGVQLRSSGTLAARALDRTVEWLPGPVVADGEESNPCLGIAIGCGLSLVAWGGLLVLFYLLR